MSPSVIEGFRPSPQQKRLWLLQQASSDSEPQIYGAHCSLLIEGELRTEILHEAALAVIRRHESLRTTFECLPGMKVPVQIINESRSPVWDEVDLASLSEAQQQATLAKLRQKMVPVSFTDAQRPLVSFTLSSLSAHVHLLLVSLPALCADVRTLENLFRELSSCYFNLMQVGEAETEVVQYVQFSEWQNELFETDDDAEERDYWRRVVRQAPAPLQLPSEMSPALLSHFAPQCFQLSVLPALTQRIVEFMQFRQHSSMELFLLAAFQILLHRLTGQSQIPIRLHCDGRVYEEMQNSFGLFERWPLLAGNFAGDMCFREILDQLDDAIQTVRDGQEYFNWELLDGEAEDVRSNSAIGFEYVKSPSPRVGPRLRFSVLERTSWTERFKLKLAAFEHSESLVAEFHYDSHFFEPEAIRRLAGQFETVLNRLLDEPEARVYEINVLSESERQQILVDWNDNERADTLDKCLAEIFADRVRLAPDSCAVISRGESLSYRELNARANQLARYLCRQGIKPDVRVGLYLERSVEMMVALLGILKAGGAYLPLDLSQPALRMAAMLEDAQARVLITQQRLSASLPEHSARVLCLDSDWPMIDAEREDDFHVKVDGEHLAYVIYTSGSTNQPKGVMIRQRSVWNLLESLRETAYPPDDGQLRLSVNAPLAFDSSVKQIFQLLNGHTLHIVPEEVRPDGQALLAFVREEKIDVLDCTPAQLRLLLEAGLGAGGAYAPARVLVGGEAVDEGIWKLISAHPATRFYNVYGPTECTVDTTICEVQALPRSPSIGCPLGNMQVYILDQRLEPVPVGVAGELYIGGEGLARGYLGQPALTARRFIPNPFSCEGGLRLYRSGDMARFLSDGKIEFLGRTDFQVKIRGFRIELEEIEAVLAAHPHVKEVVALAREHKSGDKYLAAYVVAARNQFPTRDDLRAWLRARLPEHMVPSAFVMLDKMPLTSNGKVDRKALPEPDHERPTLQKAFVAPRNESEEVVARIWVEVLQLKQVGVFDNFFDLGGHSLLVTQVISRVREAFQVELPLRSLFESYTVAGLCEAIKKARDNGAGINSPTIKRVSRDSYRMKLSAAGTLQIPKV